jgi:peptide/nickel transport system substrate-binding protein
MGPTVPCYDSSVAKYLPTPSVSQAKSILQADGFTMGSDGHFQKNGKTLAVNLLATSAATSHGPEYIAAQWEAAGVKANFTDQDIGTYAGLFQKGNFDAAIITPSNIVPAPGSFGVVIYGSPPPAGTNLGRSINPAADAEVALGEQTVGAESCKHWSNVQALKLQSHDYLPLAGAPIEWFTKGINLFPDVTLDPLTLRRI